MKKNILLILSSTIIILSMMIAGCQPTIAPVEEPVAVDEPAEDVVEEPVAGEDAAPGEVVEIVYMRQAEAHEIDLEFVEEFNNMQDRIKVVVDNVPAGDTYTKLALTTEAGNPPDVYMTYWTVGAASNGLAYDLAPFIEQEGEEWFNSYAKTSWDFNAFAGSFYGVPYRVSPVTVILNLNMFEKAGLDVPPYDWTWDDFLETARLLTNEDEDEYGYCISGSAESHGTDAQYYPFLFSAGGRMINDEGLAGFNSPEGEEALQFMIHLIEEGVVPPGTTTASNNTCVDLLVSDKAAMWIDASLWLGFIRAPHPEANITIATMPSHTASSTDNGGTGLGMASKTKHPEEAWEFLKFLTSDEIMKRWAIAADFVPGNWAVLNDPDFLADPENETVAYMLDNYKIWPLSNYPDNANLEGTLRSYIQSAYLGVQTPEEALNGAAEEWNAVLRDWQSENWWAIWTE